MDDALQLMTKLTTQMHPVDSQEFQNTAEKAIGLKEFNPSQLPPEEALKLYRSVVEKFRRHKQGEGELNWWENELRLFVWILCSYLHLRDANIKSLQQSDYQYFGRLFPNKKPILFEYQVRSLGKEDSQLRKWEDGEDTLFRELVERRGGQKYKWSELAKELYIHSNRVYFRTPKQCRERWLNHLDPNKSKQEWDIREDQILVNHVLSHEKKWAQISKLLKNRRNQHSIKNRYKSLLTKEEKSHQEHLTEKELLESLSLKYEQHFARIQPKIEAVTTSTIQKSPSMPELPQNPSRQQVSDSEEEQLADPPIPSFNSFASVVEAKDREREVRAELFLCEDPFQFIKPFFRSRDWERIQGM